MTNILLKFSNLEIKSKQIIEEKDKSIHNLQGGWRRSKSSKKNYKIGTMKIVMSW
jgi:hypothetical protein